MKIAVGLMYRFNFVTGEEKGAEDTGSSGC
jgi:hypothetical protein